MTARARRSLAALAAGAGLWVAVACLDISSPVSGITSITPVLPPMPAVVEGDSLLDTLGNVRALKVYAFAPNGDTVKDVVVRFFAIDTTNKLRVDSLSGVAFGDSLSPNARVVARVTPASGKGILQTPLLPLPVVPVPVTVVRGADVQFDWSLSTDTLSSRLLSPPLQVTVKGNADALVQSYPVSFEIVQSPPSVNGQPTLVLTSAASTHDTTVAVTNSSGVASIRLRIRVAALDPSVFTSTPTAIVRAHVRYRGAALSVTPTADFDIPVRLVP